MKANNDAKNFTVFMLFYCFFCGFIQSTHLRLLQNFS
jgi:hypothetical protein